MAQDYNSLIKTFVLCGRLNMDTDIKGNIGDLSPKESSVLVCRVARDFIKDNWKKFDNAGVGYLVEDDLTKLLATAKPCEQSIINWLIEKLPKVGVKVSQSSKRVLEGESRGEFFVYDYVERSVPVYGVSPESLESTYNRLVDAPLLLLIYVSSSYAAFTMPDGNPEEIQDEVNKRCGLFLGLFERKWKSYYTELI